MRSDVGSTVGQGGEGRGGGLERRRGGEEGVGGVEEQLGVDGQRVVGLGGQQGVEVVDRVVQDVLRVGRDRGVHRVEVEQQVREPVELERRVVLQVERDAVDERRHDDLRQPVARLEETLRARPNKRPR